MLVAQATFGCRDGWMLVDSAVSLGADERSRQSALDFSLGSR
ncbi:MAG: hypothetical protein ACAF41_06115 [Leptolyngbya sp. BL-A-14]